MPTNLLTTNLLSSAQNSRSSLISRRSPRWAAMALLACLLGGGNALAQEPPAVPPDEWGPVSINLEEIPYPYPVHFVHRNLYGQDVRIAYMDAHPTVNANGQTVVLLHGSSYYSWYWEHTMEALTDAGYRVVAVDRL